MSRRILVNQLESARRQFAGIGTRQTKLKLNRLKESNPVAKALRIALEIEDCSTQAKKYPGEWRDIKYKEKSDLIHKLIQVFEVEGWTYGKHNSNDYHTRHIVYFEIPGCEQISFHCTLRYEIPIYSARWDGKTNSTLGKLEKAISDLFDSDRFLSFD